VDFSVKYTFVCCSYRGYWTSKGRANEKGIALDAVAALNWIKNDANNEQVDVIIWGQSIGAGVATHLAAQQALFSKDVALKSLVLETPFLNIRAMLETLYPQKWLPYRYLWPFLRNHLDSWKALGVLKEDGKKLGIDPPGILILEAGKDELVPKLHGEMLETRCIDLGLDVRKQLIEGAYHPEVMVRPGGRPAVVEAILKAIQPS